MVQGMSDFTPPWLKFQPGPGPTLADWRTLQVPSRASPLPCDRLVAGELAGSLTLPGTRPIGHAARSVRQARFRPTRDGGVPSPVLNN